MIHSQYDEHDFVKLHVSDSGTWCLLDWDAQCVLLHLWRLVDRHGRMPLGIGGLPNLAVLLRAREQSDRIVQGAEALIAAGVVRLEGTTLSIPCFPVAQASKPTGYMRSLARRIRKTKASKQPQPSGSVVYFIEDQSDRSIKIGYTSNLRQRLASLCSGRPERLLVLASYPGGIDQEEIEHDRWKHIRIGGSEWFQGVPELHAYVVAINRGTA